MNTPTSLSPTFRPRRLRRGQRLRDSMADVVVTPNDLILPLFVRHGESLDKPVSSMPGVSQLSPDLAAARIKSLTNAGLHQFILFGVVESDCKDATGSPALDDENPVNLTLKMVRDAGLDAIMYVDLCFCEYTDHGHCGVLHQDPQMTVNNDVTLALLGEQAVALARNGADVVAPSGMMDGQVAAIRAALDGANFPELPIFSYTSKYASSFYGPFREAGEGAPSFGDRKSYQMDYRRSREWATELAQDIEEGADMVMVKPAMTYLDIIREMRQATDLPLGAYHVSGEYSQICAAAERGWIDLEPAAVEATYAMKRAGADLILTYFADRMVDWL